MRMTSAHHRSRLTWRVAMLLLAVLLLQITAFGQQADTFDHALHLFKSGSYEKAVQAFGAVTAIEPERSEAQLYLGKSLINLSRFGEAEIVLRRYTAMKPAAADGTYLLAYVCFRQGRAKESLAAYEIAVQLQAPQSDDLKIIGLDYGLLNDFERSAEWLRKALDLNPQNLEAHYYLGRVYFTQNRFAEAVKVFEAVLARDPRHIKAQNNLGQAREGLNDIDGALTAYRRAIELDRTSTRPSELPLLNLAVLLLQRDEVEEALSLLIRAAAINPASVPARFHLGKAYLRGGRLADAERELTAATKLDPDDKGAHYQLGRLYHRLGKADLARRELEISERLAAKERP
jgi:tetratricopeptide (TPR) repeat protein